RNIGRDIKDQVKTEEKNGDISEEELRSESDDVEKGRDNWIKEIDELVAEKEKDIM
uniref:ribosome recycling factor n=1 Tax=Staphylococcus epidermidis TaxID=1282 RepID=UPI0011A2193C